MNRELENILQTCLERVLNRGEDLERCLEDYPEHAAEIKPLVETALATRRALDIKPSAEFRSRARYQFQQALAQSSSRKKPSLLGWLPRWAPVPMLILGLLVAGAGTVAAAGYSMPDSPLYPVKIASEQVQLELTPSGMGKAELQMSLADRRVNEIVYLANKGDTRSIEAVAENLNDRLENLAGLLSAAGETGKSGALAPAAAPEPNMMAVPEPTPSPAPQTSARAPAAAAVPTLTPAPTPPPRMGVAENGGGKDAAVEAVPGEPAKLDPEKMRLKAAILRYAANHPAVLQSILENAPESSRPALRHAITVMLKAYVNTLNALD